jgi:hypothetical protein
MAKHLNCFYDFAVSPAYYDFLIFLQAAELHRIRHDFEKLRIIFVPGPKNGFRNDTLRTTESNQLMLRNVLIPSCHLLESCSATMILDERGLAAGMMTDSASIFPRDYHIEKPINDYMEPAILCAFLRDERISYFTAPADKQRLAKGYIKSIAGEKRPLTLTLREAEHDSSPSRNVNQGEWQKFFNSLDHDLYQPIIIRDTACTYAGDDVFKQYPHAPLASTDVLFRTALYENTYINFFVNNGPYACAIYSRSNSIVFKYSDEAVFSTSSQFLLKNVGIGYGDQRPITEKRTVIVWENDDAEIIAQHFNAMMTKIEQKEDLSEQNNFSNRKQIESIIEVCLSYLFSKINYSVNKEDILVLKRIEEINTILSEDPNWTLNLKNTLLENEGQLIPKGSYASISELNERLELGLNIS